MRFNKGALCALLAFIAPASLAQETSSETGEADAAAQRQLSDLPRPLTAADVNAWLDGYVPLALKAGDIAGGVVVVVKDGEILTQRGYGYADIANRTPVNPERTLFRTGSVGKLFTWTAVMQLVEQGKIDLDADVNAYLDFEIPARAGKPVTMRNLMQHVAGFEEQVKNVSSRELDTFVEFEAILKRWTPKRIYAPETTPAYSNYGVSLAGYIVQRVSGEAYEDYIKRHIFDPLDMTMTTSQQPLPLDLAPLMSKGYTVATGKANKFEILGPLPAGGQTTTGKDMAHFMIAHLQRGEFRGRRILRPETVEQMHSSELTIIPKLNRMKLGFFENDVNGHNVSGHGGDTVDFHTYLYLMMDEGVGFFVGFNTTGTSGASVFIRQQMFEDFVGRYFPNKEKEDGRVDPETAAKHAALMAGGWISSRRQESSVIAATNLFGGSPISVGPDGTLIASPPGVNMKPRRWVEIEPFVWRDVNSRQKLAAVVVDGKPVRYGVDMFAPVVVFDRPPWHKDTAWLMPLFLASVAALGLTFITWPAAAIIRKRYGASLSLEPRALNAYRANRIVAFLILAGLAAWMYLLTTMLSDFTNLSARTDAALRFVQIFGAVVFIGGFAAAARNCWITWIGKRSWFAKAWSFVIALSALTVLYIAVVFKMIHFGVYY